MINKILCIALLFLATEGHSKKNVEKVEKDSALFIHLTQHAAESSLKSGE